jgi:two-component system chemotaxis response regulator CheB
MSLLACRTRRRCLHCRPCRGRGHNILASIFDRDCPIGVSTAVDGERLQSGHAYVAPTDRHLIVVDGAIKLGHGPRENLARPAIDPLFRSVGVSHGPRAIGVVLTGMLNDGAAGLADLKRCGGVAVVQNPSDAQESAMPLEALRVTDVDYRAPLVGLGALLADLVCEPVGPAREPPEDIKLEVDIALGRPVGPDETSSLGNPSQFSCPACGGVLSELRRSRPLRFRCQVGHGYTAEALALEKEGSVDEAMRVALRIVEERAALTERMAHEARRSGLHLSASEFDLKTAQSRRHVKTLRNAMWRAESDKASRLE